MTIDTLTEREAALIGIVIEPDAGLLTEAERRYVTSSPTGLTFSEATPLEVWCELTVRLFSHEKRINWYIADAINFGERRFGEMYSQALEATGLSEGTLRNITSIGREFDLSRRRDNLSFWDHGEVKKLEPEDADKLLDDYQEQGYSQKKLREKADVIEQTRKVEKALSAPSPVLSSIPRNVRIELADARHMPLAADVVHLTVTSPPYGVGKEYKGIGDVLAEDWPSFLLDFLTEVFRVTAPNGRLALNVPLDTTRGGFRPTYSQTVQLAEAAGWTYRTTIVWLDDQLGKSTARGSYDAELRAGTAAAPHVIAGAEMIPLFSKGAWHRDEPARMVPGHPDWMQQDEWLAWTNGVWRFPGETKKFEGHEAPFPARLPYQLVKLLSFPGDTVLDPFSGSGTTGAVAHRLNRDFIGFDVVPGYVDSSLRRVIQGAV